MRPSILVLLATALTLLALPAQAVTVSGVVTTSDGSTPAGFQITVEQVGGELPLFHATTAANGTWAVSDPLLFGNIRVTASKAGYRLTPAFLDRFTNVANITDANFSAQPLVGDLTVLSVGGAALAQGATLVFADQFPAHVRTLTFTVRNDGIAPLSNIQLALSGPQAAEFAVATAPPDTLAVGASGMVVLVWTPAAMGPRSAQLAIASSDPDENPFLLTVSGTALDPARLTVSTVSDSGPGSLRSALAEAAAVPGPHRIVFAPGLAGATLPLTAELAVNDSDGVEVDASALSAQVALDGGTSTRHFRVPAGSQLTLVGLGLVNGSTAEDRGGSIRNEGQLALRRCTLRNNFCAGNSAPTAGGAIFNAGPLSLEECLLQSNAADSGGALYNEFSGAGVVCQDCYFFANGTLSTKNGGAIASSGTLAVFRCTFFGNSTISRGGALLITGRALLDHCTLDSNLVFGIDGGGGGLRVDSGGLVTLRHCTVTGCSNFGLVTSGNGQAGLDSCIFDGNTPAEAIGGGLVGLGPNLLGVLFAVSGVAPTLGHALLAPLKNYGGLTPTRALRPDSPARNAAVGSTATADQRGFPIVGVPDLGAYEAGTLAPNFDAYIWETLPASASANDHAAGFDFDGDGRTNFEEWLALTDAADARSAFAANPRSGGPGGTDLVLEFHSAVGRRYRLLENSALDTGSFAPSPGQPELLGDGQLLSFTVASPRGPKRFYRIEARP